VGRFCNGWVDGGVGGCGWDETDGLMVGLGDVCNGWVDGRVMRRM